jgi:hypothetical protein
MKKLMIGLMAASLVLGTTSCKSEKERRIKKYGALERAKTSEENYAESIYNQASNENGSYNSVFKVVYEINLQGTKSKVISPRTIINARLDIIKYYISSNSTRKDSAHIFKSKYESIINLGDASIDIPYRYFYSLNWYEMPTDNIDDGKYAQLDIWLSSDKKYLGLPSQNALSYLHDNSYYPYQGELDSFYR